MLLDAADFGHPSTPPTAPVSMPDQDLKTAERVRFARPDWRTRLARLVTFGGALGLTVYASYQMVIVVSLASVTALQWAAVALFAVTFAWIALAAMSAVAGTLLGRMSRPRTRRGSPVPTRTALLMPIYNEDPSRTFAALQAMGSGLVELGAGASFEIFVISDTTDPDIWIKETAAFHAVRDMLQGRMAIWYRHRRDNAGKKAGNVRDFVTHWGGRYEHMIVLDADSLLSASTLLHLAREMQADPSCGILQSVPKLCDGSTLLGRLQQFATAVYGPIVARGIAAWQGDDGNYWGHNAIIRVQAFAEAAGLPVLPGRKPFGGEILSHDFVEAALVRRAGWSVRMWPALEETWEEPPPSLLDVAARDRRWAQGNLQHLSIIFAKGLRWPNRAHLLIGAMSYLASPVWLTLILVGLALTTQPTTAGFDYFPDRFSLFPHWPIFDSKRMLTLLALTAAVLLLPKALGLLRAIADRRLRPAGVTKLCVSVVLETILSALYAPILMLIQSQQISEILRGKDAGWMRQQREHRTIVWRTLVQRHLVQTVLGILLAVSLVWLSPRLLLWMSPLVTALVLAVPLSRVSGSGALGSWLRRRRLLVTPEEIAAPSVIALRERFRQRLRTEIETVTLATLLEDDQSRHRHFSAVRFQPPRPRSSPDIGLLAVRHKIARAESVGEALASLSTEEQLALLAHAEVLNSLRALDRRSDDGLSLRHD